MQDIQARFFRLAAPLCVWCASGRHPPHSLLLLLRGKGLDAWVPSLWTLRCMCCTSTPMDGQGACACHVHLHVHGHVHVHVHLHVRHHVHERHPCKASSTRCM
jgi:hypothetical protein